MGIENHAYQLADAGLDVIILDVNEQRRLFPDTYLNICDGISKMRGNDGGSDSYISFLGSEIREQIMGGILL